MEKTCESQNAFDTWERGEGRATSNCFSKKVSQKEKEKSPAHVRGETMSLQETHQCLLLTINMSRSGVLTDRRRRWHGGSSAFLTPFIRTTRGCHDPNPSGLSGAYPFPLLISLVSSFSTLSSSFAGPASTTANSWRPTAWVKRLTRFAEEAFHDLPEGDCALTLG